MAFTEKGRQEVIDGALSLLAHKERHGSAGAVYATAREVWASITTTQDTHYLSTDDVLTILKEEGFFHSRYNGRDVEFTLRVS